MNTKQTINASKEHDKALVNLTQSDRRQSVANPSNCNDLKCIVVLMKEAREVHHSQE